MQNISIYIAVLIIALLGIMHVAFTLHDFVKTPKYFSPSDESLLESMKNTQTALAPNGRNYWQGVLGFNLSHAFGLIMMAALLLVTDAYQINILKLPLVAVSALYVCVSYRCWFYAPTISMSVVTLFLVVAWWR